MFEFLPDWFKTIFGFGMVVFIAVAGFKITSKKGSGGNGSDKGGSDSK